LSVTIKYSKKAEGIFITLDIGVREFSARNVDKSPGTHKIPILRALGALPTGESGQDTKLTT
jgi:hypothetical protein